MFASDQDAQIELLPPEVGPWRSHHINLDIIRREFEQLLTSNLFWGCACDGVRPAYMIPLSWPVLLSFFLP
jgi:hypothetical protein